ncbi:PQQ-binding-like beta-propeller repeat protein [Streptomyces sp. NPDC004232]|uniref:outer membrane protein assembly factor BamB family protein n=1 Tax=Streptomyces sp. NPDC004232 TaxID=3154454 RepID=UPI0033B07232
MPEEVRRLALWLRQLTRNNTVRDLERRLGSPKKTLWGQYLAGEKVIPAGVLERLVTELAEPLRREKLLDVGHALRRAAEEALLHPSLPNPRPAHGPGDVAALQHRLVLALEGQMRAERAGHRADSLVQMLIRINAVLQDQCQRLAVERDQALAESRTAAVAEARARLWEAGRQLQQAARELARARRERTHAEQIRIAAQRAAEEYRRALEDLRVRTAEQAAAHEPAALAVPAERDTTVEDAGLLLERVSAELDGQAEDLAQLSAQMGLTPGTGDEDERAGGRVVRGEVVDNPDNAATSADDTQVEPAGQAGPAVSPAEAAASAGGAPGTRGTVGAPLTRPDAPQVAGAAEGPGESVIDGVGLSPEMEGRALGRRGFLSMTAALAGTATLGGGAFLLEQALGPHSSRRPSTSSSSHRSTGPAGRTTRLMPKIAWSVPVTAQAISACARGVLAVGQSAPLFEPLTVSAFDPATGRKRWSATTSSNSLSYAAAGDAAAYCLNGDTVEALEWTKGQRLWSAPAVRVPSDHSLSDSGVYLGKGRLYAWFAYSTAGGDNSAGAVYAYGLDGRKQWSAPVGPIVVPPVEADGVLYIGSEDNHLYALDTTTGKTRWSVPFPGDVVTPAVIGATVAVGASGPNVSNLLFGVTTSGKRSWTASGVILDNNGPISTTLVAADHVFVSSSQSALYATSTAGKAAWSFPKGTARGADGGQALSSAPTLLGDTVYFFINGTLIALDAVTGTKKWDLPFPSTMNGWTKNPWFMSPYGNTLYCTEGYRVAAVHVP